ncbi:Beta-catenin-like protein 1 [Gryllus bimaculatus]|nr:Beta-catenin-like protein 1 [Gryllus bimaculatus]
MDIGELLSYKPPNTPKRLAEEEEDDDNDTDYERQKKIRKLAKSRGLDSERLDKTTNLKKIGQSLPPPDPVKQEDTLTEEEREKIMEMVENEDTSQAETLSESDIKRMILLFEKRALKNQEMRIKFPDLPEKFMESEVELHETIQELHAIALVPDLYPVLVDFNAIPSMLELLAHENTDMAVAVVDLLQELTDVDVLHESQDGAEALMDALLAQQVCALLVQNLERMDESVKEEADGVHNTLAIFENLTEFRPEVCVDAAKQGLLQWLLRRLRVKMPFDANKLYASEILSILLQNTPDNRQMLGDLEGIDTILQQLACELQPKSSWEKKLSRNGSLKVLDHAMSGPDGKENCNKFVDILGLRTIFPLFMKTPKKNRKRILTTQEHEEHVTSIIASMLRNCRGPQRQRLLSKFTENDHEKVDRLLELHFKYLEKVEEVDLVLEQERKENSTDDEDEDEGDEARYLRRLEGGLFTLQLVDYILLEVCTGGPPTIKQRVTQILNLRGGSLKTVRHVMREYAGNLGDEGDSEWRDIEQQRILQLVDKF